MNYLESPEYLYYQALINDRIGTPAPVQNQGYSSPVQQATQQAQQQSSPINNLMKLYKNGKQIYSMFKGAPLSEGANGLNVGELGIGNPASYTPAVNSLAAMGTANTAATGGLVGGADIAGLAAAEAGMGAGGAGSAGTAASAGAGMAPALGAAAIAAIALGGWKAHQQNKKTKSLGADNILRAYENGSLNVDGQDMDIVDGRYLYDPWATKTITGGQPVYYDLQDADFIERMRGHLNFTERGKNSWSIGDRNRREELMTQQPVSNARSFNNPSLASRNNALSAYNSYDPSGQKADEIIGSNRNLFNSIKQARAKDPKYSDFGR